MLVVPYTIFCQTYTWIKLKGNGAKFSNLKSYGIPMVDVEMGGTLIFGRNFRMNNGRYFNKIGRQQPSMFVVAKNAKLEFGDNVGISGTAFYCSQQISVGNNVKIGGNCVIYDTDFHSLETKERRNLKTDTKGRKSAPVIIEDDVFIGAHSIILKGVTIGSGSVIGAGSVVSKSIPSKQVWAGNPISYLKSL